MNKLQNLKFMWSPLHNGLSVSGLELWLINRVAFELKYIRNLEPIQEWNKNLGYGVLFQSCIEGFIKTKEIRGASKLLENKTNEFLKLYSFNSEDIMYYATLAEKQFHIFLEIYNKDLEKFNFTDSEKRHEVVITLPSGRDIKLKGFIDGENADSLMENKTRAEWKQEEIINEIDLNLQYNYYCLIYYAENNKLPKSVWYQHIRRPGGFGYRGPKQKKLESKEEYLYRVVTYISENREEHFYRFISKPIQQKFNRFLHICLYPILESFLDWYEYITNKNQTINKHHWLTPYGLYNPYLTGVEEQFRNYALTGSLVGLQQRVKND